MSGNHYDLTWVIGGAQGSGVDSSANIFSRACAQSGYYVFGKREYYSNIKGEHSYFTVRISDRQIRSHVDDINILVAFDAETIFRHADKVVKNGIIIYDSELQNTLVKDVPTIDDVYLEYITNFLTNLGYEHSIDGLLKCISNKGVRIMGIPYFKILSDFSQKINNPSISKVARMINVISLVSSMSITGFELETILDSINFIFKTKPNVAQLNSTAAEFAFAYVRKLYDMINLIDNERSTKFNNKILLQGNQSSALGKIVAGCRFQTYYPITPASDDSEFLETNQIIDQNNNNNSQGSILVIQTEDEISAITMAIGAALTGSRSATATSGPGFSLMVEALGWAGINEIPLVITLYQRAGPSTGLPTRHEQGDLLFAINAGHGEFPRIVFASGDIEESFYDTIKAFNFSEKYQMPVIHILDKSIANSLITCDMLNTQKIPIERGNFVTQMNHLDPEINKEFPNKKYKRFNFDDGFVSMRVPLGTENGIFWNTGDEHTEEGHITEDPNVRIMMMEKRMKKLDIALNEIDNDDKAIFYNTDKTSYKNIKLISWGSTKGAILDALDMLNDEEINLHFIQIKLMNPFPSELLKNTIYDDDILVDIEMNYSAQLGKLLKQHLGKSIDHEIVKFNGRPISANEVYYALKKVINGNSEYRVVLNNGV